MRGSKVKSRGPNYRRFGSDDGLFGSLKNITIFQYFKRGCFYKRTDSYCSNRLTDYYCVAWTNLSETEISSDVQNDTYIPQFQELFKNEECGGDFTAESILNMTTYCFPLLLLLGITFNIMLSHLTIKMAGKQLPVCYYISILAILDVMLLIVRAGDLWVQALLDINLNLITIILNRSNCQLYSAVFSFFMHLKGSLHIAMAIDTWRLIRKPIEMTRIYSSEWIRNSIILICVLLLPLNCQFVWTFDVVEQTAIKKADRSFFCGFAVKWPVDERFYSFVWPMMDLLVGDILPLLIVAIFVALSFVALFSSTSEDNITPNSRMTVQVNTVDEDKIIKKYVLNVDLYYQLRKALLSVNVIYLAFFSPTCIHDLAMYWPFARTQWSIIARPQTASLSSLESSGVKGKNIVPVSSEHHEEEQGRLYFIKLMLFFQLMANCVMFLLFITSFRAQFKQLLINMFTLKYLKKRYAAFFVQSKATSLANAKSQDKVAHDQNYEAVCQKSGNQSINQEKLICID